MLNLEQLVSDSLNHFLFDLGETPTVADIIEDLQHNYEELELLTQEDEAQLYVDVIGILGRNDWLKHVASDDF